MASAQTDYYNLDAGRPLRVEDALVIERHAFEWQVAPLRFSGARGRKTAFAVEPELAWGIMPRMQLEVGVPLRREGEGRSALGAAGVDVSLLYALNAETLSWPGLALSVGAVAPAGPFGPERMLVTVGGIATRTTSAGRVHVNAHVTPGATSRDASDDASRWRVGVAADRTFAVQSTLLGADVVAEQPLGASRVQWSAALGMRRQVGPRSAVDVGVGRRLGAQGEWFVTAGSALSFGLFHRGLR
ncbi:MAG: hypothetical protein H7066_14270 [Cytophagaceae bacterium]|nr:hypothetical protein [Gemmatimonadaceae bacterium]